jgi:uncharacterized protein YegL
MHDGMVRETLNIYYLLDTSGSMNGAKIQQLNDCMQELKPALEEFREENNIEIVIRAIEFGNNGIAQWHTGTEFKGVSIDQFIWVSLQATGSCTPTAKALEMTAAALNPGYLGKRAVCTTIILFSGSGCTDEISRYIAACNMVKTKIGGTATRIAIEFEGANRAELEEFASRGRIGDKFDIPLVFEASNFEPKMILNLIPLGEDVYPIKSSVRADDWVKYDKINRTFPSILEKFVTEKSKEILLNPNINIIKSLLADITRNEYEKERWLLLQAIDIGVVKAINEAQYQDLKLCKEKQIALLRDKRSIATEEAVDIVNLLAHVLLPSERQESLDDDWT